MYLTIHERKIRGQAETIRALARKYLDVAADIANAICEIQGKWGGSGADDQIYKLKKALREVNTTRSELLQTASMLDQYCVSHKTIWEKLTGGGD